MTSEYVRKKSKGRCYTCEGVFEIGNLNAGHFREKIGNSGAYFDLRNLRAQCYRCNRVEHGRKDVYATKLVKELGGNVLNDLFRLCVGNKQWTKYELDKIAEEREKMLKELK